MTAFFVFLVAGLGVYSARASFVLLVGDRELPAWAERMLRSVGPAVLAALITSLLLTDGAVAFVTSPAEVLGVLAATLAAAKTKSFAWAFIVGMAVFLLIDVLA